MRFILIAFLLLPGCAAVDGLNSTRSQINDRELNQGIEVLCNFATIGAISRRYNGNLDSWAQACSDLKQ